MFSFTIKLKVKKKSYNPMSCFLCVKYATNKVNRFNSFQEIICTIWEKRDWKWFFDKSHIVFPTNGYTIWNIMLSSRSTYHDIWSEVNKMISNRTWNINMTQHQSTYLVTLNQINRNNWSVLWIRLCLYFPNR